MGKISVLTIFYWQVFFATSNLVEKTIRYEYVHEYIIVSETTKIISYT